MEARREIDRLIRFLDKTDDHVSRELDDDDDREPDKGDEPSLGSSQDDRPREVLAEVRTRNRRPRLILGASILSRTMPTTRKLTTRTSSSSRMGRCGMMHKDSVGPAVHDVSMMVQVLLNAIETTRGNEATGGSHVDPW